MSEILSKTASPPVHAPEDVLENYNGTQSNPGLPDSLSRLGMEIELNFYDTQSLKPLTEKTSTHIQKQAQTYHIPLHREPSATTLETTTDPFLPEEMGALIDQTEDRFAAFLQAARENNGFASPFAHLPQARPTDHILTENERYRAFWIPYREDMAGAFDSFLEPSIQTSVSYKDWDHLLRIIRLSIALEPFLLLTTEAGSGFFHGRPVDYCPRMTLLPRRGRNGGIPDFYYTARSGEELINAHIDFTLNHPYVFACFDFTGKLRSLPSEHWTSFSALEKDGLGPKTFLNYRQAQSESWRRTVNIAEIRDEDGHVYGHRAEIASLFATGLQHQRASALLLTYAMAYSDRFYEQVTALLQDFGIHLDALDESRPLLDSTYETATHHRGQYYALPFGNKTFENLAMPLSDLLEDSVREPPLRGYADPLLHILRTGRPDWLVYREYFTSLDSVQTYLRRLPALSEKYPELLSAKSCADFILPKIAKDIAA